MIYNIKSELKSYQKETVEWMKNQESKYNGGMILSEAGTGKSLCVIAFINGNRSKLDGKVLIVCPAGLIKNWTNEFISHTDIDNNMLFEYHGVSRIENFKKCEAKIIITSYNILEKDCYLQNIKWGKIILDEAHYIRNSKTKMSGAVMNLECNSKWILTATPYFNGMNDYFAYFKFMFGVFENLKEWKKEYNNKDYKSIKALNELIKKHSIMYKKSDVLKEIPKTEYVDIQLNFTNVEREFYDALKSYCKIRIKKIYQQKINPKINTNALSNLMNSNMLTLLLRLRQCCDSFQNIKMERLKNAKTLKEATKLLYFYNSQKVLDEECPICYDEKADHIADPCGHKCCQKCWKQLKSKNCPMCRQEIIEIKHVNDQNLHEENTNEDKVVFQSSKIQKIKELTNKLLNDGKKVIIVSQWVTMIDLVKRSIETTEATEATEATQGTDGISVVLDGRSSLEKRHQRVMKFQNDPNCRICYISLMSSAEGINLNASDTVIMVDEWFNEGKIKQVEERVSRIGQVSGQIKVYRIIINNSVEEGVRKRKRRRGRESRIIMDLCNEDDYKVESEERIMDDVIEEGTEGIMIK